MTFAVIVLTSMSSIAQHCPFDNTGILVVQVIDKKTNKRIGNLTPYLKIVEDSLYYTKKPVSVENYSSIYPFSQAAAQFVPNPARTKEDWIPGYHFDSIHYTFAGDSYIRPVSMDLNFYYNMEIRIRDEDGNDLNVSYKVKPEDYFDLHLNIGDNWTEITELGCTPPTYFSFHHTITIELDHP